MQISGHRGAISSVAYGSPAEAIRVAGLDEVLIDLMGESRLTGRTAVNWRAAIRCVDAPGLWVADVIDVGPNGLSLRIEHEFSPNDALEIAVRDNDGRSAQLLGRCVSRGSRRHRRLSVTLERFGGDYIDMVIWAFCDEGGATIGREHEVDFGLADVTLLHGYRDGNAAGQSFRAPVLARVIPYRRPADNGVCFGFA